MLWPGGLRQAARPVDVNAPGLNLTATLRYRTSYVDGHRSLHLERYRFCHRADTLGDEAQLPAEEVSTHMIQTVKPLTDEIAAGSWAHFLPPPILP